MPEFLEIVAEHLRRLHLEPSILDAYPHELSGGMRQRVTIALATICRPEFIIADEPTTALDVVVQKSVLGMIREVQREMRSSILFVTHDMAVHANMADRLGIMYAGRLVEEAPTRAIFATPLHPYTAHLIESLPRIGDSGLKKALGGSPPNLSAPPPGCRFHPRCPLAMEICRREVPALTALAPGHRVACFAASPAVKPARTKNRRRRRDEPAPPLRRKRHQSLFARRPLRRRHLSRGRRRQLLALCGAIRDLHGRRRIGKRQDDPFPHDPEPRRPDDGRDTVSRVRRDPVRGRSARMRFMAAVQPIFQNPFEAFNPLNRVDRYLLTTARRFAGARKSADAERLADEALRKVGLSFVEINRRFPHELSGGQLQRVAIARALIPGPALIVADEPVSMVDASLRMAIVNLFRTLRDDLGVSIIYITHDLATAYYISDRIIIMQKGKVVESGDARAVLDNPKHPYSILLKSSVLSPDAALEGDFTG